MSRAENGSHIAVVTRREIGDGRVHNPLVLRCSPCGDPTLHDPMPDVRLLALPIVRYEFDPSAIPLQRLVVQHGRHFDGGEGKRRAQFRKEGEGRSVFVAGTDAASGSIVGVGSAGGIVEGGDHARFPQRRVIQ